MRLDILNGVIEAQNVELRLMRRKIRKLKRLLDLYMPGTLDELITHITPTETPLYNARAKERAPGTVHEWTTRVPDKAGWWWRVPYGWLLKLKARFK